MKTKLFLIVSLLMLGVNYLNAQPSQPQPGLGKPDGGIMDGLNMNSMETSFVLNVNPMNGETQQSGIQLSFSQP